MQTKYLLLLLISLITANCANDSGGDRALSGINTDPYWSYPQKSFEERCRLYLNYCAANPVTDNKAPFPQIACFELGLPVNEEILHESIDEVYMQADCNDFTLEGLIRILYLYGDRPAMSPQLKKEIETCLLDFKYWWDEPGRDRRCYHTENHQVIFHANELLAGQLFKDSTFSNSGMSGMEHMEHAMNLLERWMDFRIRFGFSEWLSNTYFDADLAGLLNLYDFAEDPEIRDRAGILIDILMFEMSLHSTRGVFGATHGRTYANLIKGGWKETTSSDQKLAFGMGTFSRSSAQGAVCFATSTYRCPEIIAKIAGDYSGTITSRERHSINLADAPLHGLSYDSELDCHLFWSIQDYINPNIIDLSQEISSKYGVRDFANYEIDKQLYTDQIEQYGKIIDPDLDYHALTEVNIETTRTSDYLLSCAQDYRAGKPGYQQHIWQATLDIDAMVFTNHPGSDNENSRPNYWAGNGIMPRAAKFENVLVCIHKIPTDDPLPFSHAYFPRDAFDELIEKDHWIFARKGDGYIALYSQNLTEWKADADGKYYDLLVSVPQNTWICELGSKAQWKRFSRFVEAVSSSEIICDELNVSYHSPSAGLLQFGWTGPLLARGQAVPLREYARFDNPFCQNEFTSREILIKYKNQELILDFEKGKRSLKQSDMQQSALK